MVRLPTARKIVDLGGLRVLLDKYRSEGRTIVFTNGCFDILHAGHVDYLERAADLGDVLVVGLNSDRSVRSIKGPSRPVVPQEQRARVLAALACVDAVVCFDEPDPLQLILEVRPDALVKGADWPLDRIIGRNEVESHGGRVERIPLIETVSTSSIIEKIRGLPVS
ncbi:MAG: D-glycero-beta-D-manno-heptose 1-phosphate adenylyltransferase [Deltaproteobacteria bacterium]|nr:D-glycero-beta-D-manno-heptose 1-phosphate adenylyltransferase [Deltaproteobacteria bacterium]